MTTKNTMPEAEKIRLLHLAGCTHSKPLIGWRPGAGPRCRLCNTVAHAEEIAS